MRKSKAVNGKKATQRLRRPANNGARTSRRSLSGEWQSQKPQLLGRYIVADPRICHGKPTFRGTRIMVWQVLEMVAEGMAWETIVEKFGGSITQEAVAEAVQLASKSFIKHAQEHVLEPLPA